MYGLDIVIYFTFQRFLYKSVSILWPKPVDNALFCIHTYIYVIFYINFRISCINYLAYNFTNIVIIFFKKSIYKLSYDLKNFYYSFYYSFYSIL